MDSVKHTGTSWQATGRQKHEGNEAGVTSQPLHRYRWTGNGQCATNQTLLMYEERRM